MPKNPENKPFSFEELPNMPIYARLILEVAVEQKRDPFEVAENMRQDALANVQDEFQKKHLENIDIAIKFLKNSKLI